MSDAAPEADLLAACYRGLDPFLRLAGSFTGSELHATADGLACVAPLIPLASIFNSVVFDRSRPESLESLFELTWPIYDHSPVMRWAAWIVEGDEQAEAIAANRGMSIDSRPRAMGARIDQLDLTASTASVSERWDMATAAVLNERAYGVPAGLFGAAAAAPQPLGVRCFLAADDQTPAAVVLSFANGSDCSIAWVASDPRFQGRGFARAAMTAALVAAREAGFATTTLQASVAGVPLYAGLGYRDLGVSVNVWQHTRYA